MAFHRTPEFEAKRLAGLRRAEVRERIAQTLKGNTNALGHTVQESSKAAMVHTGIPLSDEHKAKIATSLMGNQRRRGKRLTAEHKAIISEAMQGRQFSEVTREKLSVAGAGRLHTPEARAKMSASHRGVPLPQATRDKIRQAALQQVGTYRRTTIELALEAEFAQRGFVFTTQEPAFGKWVPDFTFAEAHLFVNADGDYWHSRPKTIERDRRFDADAAMQGWRVLHLWQHEINADVHACADLVEAAQRNP